MMTINILFAQILSNRKCRLKVSVPSTNVQRPKHDVKLLNRKFQIYMRHVTKTATLTKYVYTFSSMSAIVVVFCFHFRSLQKKYDFLFFKRCAKVQTFFFLFFFILFLYFSTLSKTTLI